jgi:hypothetical protein
MKQNKVISFKIFEFWLAVYGRKGIKFVAAKYTIYNFTVMMQNG